jgi:hypothetical protein
LQEFDLSEWFPRAPGAFWTELGISLRTQARHLVENMGEIVVYTARGKMLMVQGGIGTIRLKPHGTGNTQYKILGASSSGSLSCGIPVVMPAGQYEKIRDRLLETGSISATVTGLYSAVPVSDEQMVLKAAGFELDKGLQSWIAKSFYVPRHCVLVESIVLIDNVRAGRDVAGAAWSIYQTEGEEYGWTYSSFDPRQQGSVDKAVAFLNDYAHNHRLKHFLTEFDEGTARLNAEWPLDQVLSQNVSLAPYKTSMLRWSERTLQKY